MKLLIRRFDEVISEKVNKFALIELEQKIKLTYLSKSKWDDIEENYKETQSQIRLKMNELNSFVED